MAGVGVGREGVGIRAGAGLEVGVLPLLPPHYYDTPQLERKAIREAGRPVKQIVEAFRY